MAMWALADWENISEVNWKYFEDIRRAIFLYQTCLAPASQYNSAASAWSGSHTWLDEELNSHDGYAGGSIVYSDGMFWIASYNQTTHGSAPTKANWTTNNGWKPMADSLKYYHHCQNSIYYRTFGNCGHSGCTTKFDVFHASNLLPSQTWHLTNVLGFTEWDSGTAYKVGDRCKVTDNAMERDGMICGFECIAANTNQKPTTTFPNTTLTTGGSYWRLCGEPVEVSSKAFLSNNIGAAFQRLETGVFGDSYHRHQGWPVVAGEIHSDAKYQEYQSAVERMCEALPWVFETDATYHWPFAPTEPYDEKSNDWGAKKPKWACGQDPHWNCNFSTFELILKKLGTDRYVWYWDDTYYPDRKGDVGTYPEGYKCWWCEHINYPSQSNPQDNHPIWRRTWRYSMRALEHLRLPSVVNDTHDGAGYASKYPPTGNDAPNFEGNEADGAGYATSQIYKDHSLHKWHGNPLAAALTDMKDVLDELSKFFWDADIALYKKEANVNKEVTYSFNSQAAAESDANGDLATAYAAASWASTTGNFPPERKMSIFYNPATSKYSRSAFSRGWKYVITLTDPPRNGSIKAESEIALWSRACNFWNDPSQVWDGDDQYLTGGFWGDRENNVWTAEEGGTVEARTQDKADPYADDFEESIVKGAFADNVLTVILNPPTDTMACPTCPVDCGESGTLYQSDYDEWGEVAFPNYRAILEIDKTVNIL